MREDLRRRKQRAYLRSVGRPATVDADPAVRHVRVLINRHGMSTQRIADLARVSASLVWEVYTGKRRSHGYGRVERMWRPTRDALLAVQPEGSSGRGARIPDIGTRRRLQALVAQGFPGAFLAPRLGWPKQIVNLLVANGRKAEWVYWASFRKVADLFEELDGADPAGLGVAPGPVTRARAMAVRRGFAPRSCWDDDTIDDPEAIPEWTGRCGTPFGLRLHDVEGIPVCPACEACRGERLGVLSGDRLRDARVRRGLSQRGVAVAAGVASDQYRLWESGRSKPKFQADLERVLVVLDVTFEQVCQD